MGYEDDRKRVAAELFGAIPPALGFYFRVSDNLLARRGDYALQVQGLESGDRISPRPVTYDDVLDVAAVLRRDPTLTLDQASAQLKTQPGTARPTQHLTAAILVSAQALLMLDFTKPGDMWQTSERFVDFVSRRIPKTGDFPPPRN